MDFLPATRGQQEIKCLLLLYLFVARTLGDCPRPVLVQNIVLSDSALLMNKFPDNVEISLDCPNGYIKDSGSGIMKCTDGVWGNPDLTCKKKDCGIPPLKSHMTYNLSQGTLFGALAIAKCDKGYLVKGPAYIRCYNAGWTGKSAKCEIVTCNEPGKVANGMSSWRSDDSPTYGAQIIYSCDEGYTLIGNSTITCTENQEYDSTPPQCQGVTKTDVFTTQMVTTPISTSPATEASTSTDSDTSTGHRDTTLTASATPTVSLSAQEEQSDGSVHTKTDGHMPVIISVVCVSLVACILVLFIHKQLLKRKGSYDTREDLKPELLQFQNL